MKHRFPRFRKRSAARQRGVAFIVAIVLVLIIGSLLLVFARQMQTEAVASSNHRSAVQARLIAEGMARALLVELDQPQDEIDIDADGAVLGDGLYWIVRIDHDDDRQHTFGVTSEAGKVNLNTAPADTLRLLPNMDESIAAAIVDWRDADHDPTEHGAESEYYLARRPTYVAKNAPFETVDELRLVRDVDRALFDGEDWNRNGVLDASENDAGRRNPPDNADGRLERGLRPYVTIHSREPNVSRVTGRPRLNINEAEEDELEQALSSLLTEEQIAAIMGRIDNQRPYANMIAFFAAAQLDELLDGETGPLLDRLTTSDAEMLPGRIDAAAAPAAVFEALPELEPGDGDALLAARASAGAPRQSWQWVIEALGEEKAIAVGDRLTLRSFQFAADIVAISGDGRAFHRLRVVVDLAGAAPRLVHAADWTSLGWPLDPAIRDALRGGATPREVALRYGSGQS